MYLFQKQEETAISLAVTVANAKLVDEAYVNEIPVKPKKLLIFLIALIFGMALPISLIYILELLDTKVHSRRDIEENTQIPILVKLWDQ